MPNIVNEMVVREMAEDLKDISSMLVVSFGGLTVSESEAIRTSLAEKGIRLRMTRNKLLRRVLAERGIELAGDIFTGNNAIVAGDAETAIGAAKVFDEKDVKKLKKTAIKGGLLEGEVLDAEAAQALAALPDRDTLRAMMLGVISGPARGLATVINAVPASVARVIQAHADEMDSGELEKAG